MAKPKTKISNIAVWIILGLLVLALAGFGIDSFGGSVRTVGKVGDREIRVNDYFRALQNEIRVTGEIMGTPLTFQEAQRMGLDRQVLGQLVTRAAIENEALQVGVSAGDDRVREELLAVPAFRNTDGSFNREAYRFTLQQQGLSEREFEEQLRFDLAREILQAAVIAAAPAPPALVDTLFDWTHERRAFTVVRLDRRALPSPLPTVTDEELRALYDANPEDYTLPEARRITYAWLTPAMLIDTVEVDEQSLREAYDARADEFIQPERRLVDRLVFPDMTAAQAARDRLDADEVDFDALVAERGFTIEDVDLGDITRAQLDAEVGAAVFGLEAPGVVGPFVTGFGPALFRMNAVLAEQVTSFEEALPFLRDELAQDRAMRVIADQFDLFEDLLAGGATLEQLADETEMRLGQIDLRPATRDGIAGYEAFRAAAARAREGGFPALEALEDGGIFALRLDEIVPPQLQPFDAVTDQLIEDWVRTETEARLMAEGERLAVLLAAGADPDDFGLPVEVIADARRESAYPGVPRAVVAAAFDLAPGETRVLADRSGDAAVVNLIRLDEVIRPDPDSDEARRNRAAIADQLRSGMQQDLFTAFTVYLEQAYPIEINEQAIQAVHSQFR